LSEMSSKQIDDDGNFTVGGKKYSLLGTNLPVPADVSMTGTAITEEVLLVANLDLRACPACRESTEGKLSVVLVTENYRLHPSRCCCQMIWLTEVREEREQ
jgi:hypothetical protein